MLPKALESMDVCCIAIDNLFSFNKYRMNLQELDSYKLSDAVKFHNRLNPRLWGADEHLLPEVRDKLLEIAADFQEFLGISDLDLVDITFSGSNAAYSYTPHSDIDLHLIVRAPAGADDVYKELFNAKKYQYNDLHDIKIRGADVELYVQPAEDEVVSLGEYSIKDSKWLQVPRRKRAKIDQSVVRHKYEDLKARIESALKDNDSDRIYALIKKIKEMRQAGLDQHGEFGPENLAYKMLRSQGYIDKLYQTQAAARDRELSLKEKAPVAKPGAWWNIGEADTGIAQGSAISDTGAQSTWDGVDPDTDEFLSEQQETQSVVRDFIRSTAQKLGIKRLPKIVLHTDGEWSEQEHSFGRYVPEAHELHVSLADRHLMDILRTTAHELAHCRQHEISPLPDDAGETGSKWENQAHAVAGVVMRDFAEQHPDLFESSGYIPTAAEKNDPRFVMALSPDVQPGAIGLNANKMALKTDAQGKPALLMKTVNLQESMMQELAAEFALLENEVLSEIKMSTASLRQEAAKTGARAGMEFEMIVPNVDEEDLEPEYERDEDRDRRARSFSDIEDFFYDGDYNGRGYIRRLMEKLNEAFLEWKMDQIDMDWANEGSDYLRDYVENNDMFDREEALDEARDEIIEANPDLPTDSEEFQQLLNARINEMQEQFVEREFDARGRVYDDALEAFRDEKNEDYDEGDFLEETTPYMSDVESEYDITWPYYYDINDGRGGEMSVDQVADDFSAAIGRPVNASSSYHGGRREPGKYVVEPDGSLDADNPGDGGLEFVSPPLPIDELITDLNKVKKWAGDYGCYTNDSTGLHINISVPDYSLDKLDYVKLALLMGDEYVLDLFGRSSNTYTAAATGKIRDALKKNPDLAPQLMDKMRGHMEDLATKAIHSGTTNKYTSINTKNGYIEFRSPGGDWLDANFDKIENTLLRFTVALSAAINPEAYRQEYLKKLYKFLAASQDKGGVDVVQLFANYSAGDLDKESLIRQVRQKQLSRNVEKGKTTGKMWWEVSKPGNFASIEVVASSKEEAISKALEPGNYPEWASARNTLQAEPLRPYQEKTTTTEPATSSQGNWGIWMSGPGRFARQPGQTDNSVLRRFPSREAAEQFITQTRAERPDMRTDIDVREIEPARADQFQEPSSSRGDLTPRGPGPWEIYRISSNTSVRELSNTSRPEAEAEARRALGLRGEAPELYGVRTRQTTDFSQMGSNTTGSRRWQIFRMSDGRQVGEFNANNHAEAERHMERTLTNAGMDPDQYDVRQAQAAQPQAGDIVAPGLGEVPAGSNQVGQTYTPTGRGEFTGQWLVVDANNRILYKFGGIGNSQSDANNVAIRWLQQNPAHMQAGVEVVPEMG